MPLPPACVTAAAVSATVPPTGDSLPWVLRPVT
jgi:hypothetical protein